MIICFFLSNISFGLVKETFLLHTQNIYVIIDIFIKKYHEKVQFCESGVSQIYFEESLFFEKSDFEFSRLYRYPLRYFLLIHLSLIC